jgi:hypothetical protein
MRRVQIFTRHLLSSEELKREMYAGGKFKRINWDYLEMNFKAKK